MLLQTDAVAVPTLFNQRRKVSAGLAKKSTKRIAQFGLGAVMAGSMGKGMCLSDDEIVDNVEPWRDGLDDLPLTVGALRATEQATMELAGRLADTKIVDCVMIFVSPYRAGTNAEEDALAVSRIVNAYPKQQFGLYVFTENGSPISETIWDHLGSCDNIGMTKFTDSHPGRYRAFCEAAPDSCQVVNGCTPRTVRRHRLEKRHKKERCRFIDGGSSPILQTVSELSVSLTEDSISQARKLQTWSTAWCAEGSAHGYSQFAWNAAAWSILIGDGSAWLPQHIPVKDADLSKVEAKLREYEEL